MCSVTAMMVASTALSAGSAIQQGQAASDAAAFNAEVSQQNAVLADRRAKDALERGQIEEEKAKRQSTIQQKQQEASFSASNLDLGYGSPLDVLVATATAGEMEAATVRANAEREVEDFQVQGTNSRNNARLNRMSSRNAKSAGIFNAGAAAVNGGAGILKYRAGLEG